MVGLEHLKEVKQKLRNPEEMFEALDVSGKNLAAVTPVFTPLQKGEHCNASQTKARFNFQ